MPGTRADAGILREERRNAERVTMLIRSAALEIDHRQYLCVIRDVSRIGVSFRVFHPVPAFERAVLRLGNGDTLALHFARSADGTIACTFAKEADVARIVGEPSAYRRRRTRIEVTLPGTLSAPDGNEMVCITNLSQQGARLECGQRYPVHTPVKLAAQGLPEVACTVRWSRDGEAGLVFEETFGFEEFARLVAEL